MNEYMRINAGAILMGSVAAAEATAEFQISKSNSDPIVTIRADGTVVLNPNYTPDEAARAFWDAVDHVGRERRAK